MLIMLIFLGALLVDRPADSEEGCFFTSLFFFYLRSTILEIFEKKGVHILKSLRMTGDFSFLCLIMNFI